jgi:hypothetical protein
MANIKVSELTTATQFNDEDYTMIVQNGENKKITKENAFNDINEEINTKTQRHVITVQLENNFSKTIADYETLPFTVETKAGTKLTLSNNSVIIGSGVSKIKVSAKASFNTIATSGLKWLTIFKNNDAVSPNPRNLSARDMIYATEVLVSVNENDIITVKVNGTINDVIRGGIGYTYLTVEVVE